MNAMRMVSALGGALVLTASFAVFADNNGGPVTQDAAPGSLQQNLSASLCTAAINSDGTIAGGVNTLISATFLGGGSYEVIFKGACSKNITAAAGWARFVQVDTLTTGSIGDIKCTTADRAGNPAGVWVNCTNGAGTD